MKEKLMTAPDPRPAVIQPRKFSLEQSLDAESAARYNVHSTNTLDWTTNRLKDQQATNSAITCASLPATTVFETCSHKKYLNALLSLSFPPSGR